MHKRVLIAGGYGLVGGTLARLLRRSSRDVEIWLAGRSPEVGEALAKELGNARVLRLDVDTDDLSLAGLERLDAVVACLADARDALFQQCIEHALAHIGIARLADGIAPQVFAALKAEARAPVVLLGHWQAGVLTLVAEQAAAEFRTVESVAMAALFDKRDPVGKMTAGEMGGYAARGLIREASRWRWLEARAHARRVETGSGTSFNAIPLAVLDVPSIVASTRAASARFDVGLGDSLGTRAGRAASHDLYIDITGVLRTGARKTRRTMVSDPEGQAHMTALGALLALERVLGLDGGAAPRPGLYGPDTLLNSARAMERIADHGVQVKSELVA